jgi:2'-5' RNA ligase
MAPESAVRAVVAFPMFEPDDRQWLEALRARHDPESKRIGPHFTLVFPAVLPPGPTEAHVARVGRATQPIRFVLRRAAVAADASGSGGHVFLIPEEGRDALGGLHERLYEGPLQPHWKRAASFTPHLSVAAGTAIDALHALAGDLNHGGIAVHGSISEIVLVGVTPAEIRPLAHFLLGPAAEFGA